MNVESKSVLVAQYTSTTIFLLLDKLSGICLPIYPIHLSIDSSCVEELVHLHESSASLHQKLILLNLHEQTTFPEAIYSLLLPYQKVLHYCAIFNYLQSIITIGYEFADFSIDRIVRKGNICYTLLTLVQDYVFEVSQ